MGAFQVLINGETREERMLLSFFCIVKEERRVADSFSFPVFSDGTIGAANSYI
jgi:hypothetical protein